MSAQSKGHDARPVPVIVHLSGRFRGTTHRLFGDRFRIGTTGDAEIRFSAEDLTPGLSRLSRPGPYAVLERRDSAYELETAPEADIWVNGRRVERATLTSGDLIEVGQGGPVLRFRVYAPGSRGYKSVTHVFADCLDTARRGGSVTQRAGLLMAGTPMGLLTQTAPAVRLAFVAVLLGLVGTVGWLWARNEGLKQRLEAEQAARRQLAELMELSEDRALSTEDLSGVRAELDSRLSESLARIEALEARAGAREQVIADTARSVVFLQGAYGFSDESGRPLRFAGLGPEGTPLRDSTGEPEITLEGEGPPIEIFYTGTAFVVTEDGYLLTNRHVALPWAYEAPLELMSAMGLAPVMRRFIGYLPGVEKPFPVEFVRASDTRDVALLRCDRVEDDVRPLALAEAPPHPGDEVIVMGYPAGLQALMARTDPEAIEEILESGAHDFWLLARRLAEGGHIEPLATVGVVGQVTRGSVVYDAETTHGGSGGPVLNLEGRVLAVNTAILPEFGGSNLGVPAAEAFALLLQPDPPVE